MRLHGTTSQKTVILTLIAVRTWNLTIKHLFIFQNHCTLYLRKALLSFHFTRSKVRVSNDNLSDYRSFGFRQCRKNVANFRFSINCFKFHHIQCLLCGEVDEWPEGLAPNLTTRQVLQNMNQIQWELANQLLSSKLLTIPSAGLSRVLCIWEVLGPSVSKDTGCPDNLFAVSSH
jgi:hypothetical protein